MANRVLENNRVVLVENGDFRYLRDHLLQEGVLYMHETQSIEAKETTIERMSTLLDVMFRKPVAYKKRFLECLRKANKILYDQLSWTKGNVCPVVPVLRFTRVDGGTQSHVVIEAGRAAVRDGRERAWRTTVRTGGLLGADRRVYWETRLVWSPEVSVPDSDSDWWEVGGVGVRREGSDFGTLPPGWDEESWGVWIQYNHSRKTWWYVCRPDGEYIFLSAPVTATPPSVSHRLGLLLDPGARTLTAVDVNTNTRLYTFSLLAGDAGSQRLVPVVWFGDDVFERRFSLPGVDPSRLPGPVTDLLHN